MGQYGAMQILSSIIFEYHTTHPCLTYSHNFLSIPDAAGKNNIFNKIKGLSRIQAKCGLFTIVLKGKETFTVKMHRKIDSRRQRPV